MRASLVESPAAAGRRLRACWLGRVGYDAAHALQIEIRRRVAGGAAPSTLLLLEHEPVVTLGRREGSGDLLISDEAFEERGIALRRTERGGGPTYHGPGQLVAYPICPLRSVAPDVPTFVGGLEQAILDVVEGLGVRAHADPGRRGVWVGEAKLASIGIAISRGVCWHGFAINVDPDLAPFELIRPCGLEVEVTSLAQCVSAPPSVPELAEQIAQSFAKVFGLDLALGP